MSTRYLVTFTSASFNTKVWVDPAQVETLSTNSSSDSLDAPATTIGLKSGSSFKVLGTLDQTALSLDLRNEEFRKQDEKAAWEASKRRAAQIEKGLGV